MAGTKRSARTQSRSMSIDCAASSNLRASSSARYGDSATCLKKPRMARIRTLRSQLLAWLAVPLLVLWLMSTLVDYDIAKRFTNLAYDRALLEAALDIGRQVK